MANENGKRYNVTGSTVTAGGDRISVKHIAPEIHKAALIDIERTNGHVFMPTTEDRAATQAEAADYNQGDATFADYDLLDELDNV